MARAESRRTQGLSVDDVVLVDATTAGTVPQPGWPDELPTVRTRRREEGASLAAEEQDLRRTRLTQVALFVAAVHLIVLAWAFVDQGTAPVFRLVTALKLAVS